MTKPAASRLISRVQEVSRRQHHSTSTKRTLVDVAEDLFTEHGYAGTSLDAIVAGADVTKGALYHHFSGKQDLFEAVFERVEAYASQLITDSIQGLEDPWEKSLTGLRTFLEVVRAPQYRRIVVQEGPAVLGYERFREQEELSTFAVVVEIVESVLAAGAWELDPEMTHTFSRIFFGAMNAAGGSVATHEDPAAESARVETAVGFILTGLRALVDAGIELPDPDQGPGEGPDVSER